MRDSKPLCFICDQTNILGTIWDTELGKIVVMNRDIDIQNNLSIRNCIGDEIDNIDLRNVLMSILLK